MRLLILCLALTGCAATDYDIARDQAVIISHIVDALPDDCMPRDNYAFACSREVASGVFEMYILRDYYPECIKHEFRHAHEGDWHQGPSVEDC